MCSLQGSLQTFCDKLRADIVKCLSHVEAFIDFSEDENIEMDVLDNGGYPRSFGDP